MTGFLIGAATGALATAAAGYVLAIRWLVGLDWQSLLYPVLGPGRPR